MGQQENRLFRVIDRSIRQTWLIVFDQGDTILAGDILRGDDYELVPIKVWSEHDIFYFAAGDAATHRRAVQHVRQNHVVDVPRFSRNFSRPSCRGTEVPTMRPFFIACAGTPDPAALPETLRP